jgi:pyruvate dehydrogenase E2 component (dihydrolipoamide acetyltransferase)
MEVETDKALVEIEAEADGILSQVSAREGDVIAVGQVIAWILSPGEKPPASTGPSPTSGRAHTPQNVANSNTTRSALGGAPAERPLMSPKARRLAAEQGIDPRALAATTGGVITAKDLAPGPTPSGPQPGTVWRVMAERMLSAWTTVPQFHVSRDVDVTPLVAARERLQAAGSKGVTYTDLLVIAVAQTLSLHPRINASWTNGTVRYHNEINIGLAVAVDEGVTVPVLHAVDRLTAAEVAAARAALVERARAGRLRPADLAGGTFTVSNLGAYQVDAFTAIVNPPEAAILAVGAIKDRLVPENGHAVVRPSVTLTLSCDHRVIDGARGAAFLNDLVATIEKGESFA